MIELAPPPVEHAITAPEMEITKSELGYAFPDGSYFLGITAVHGFEPSIIVANIGIAINDELEANGLGRKPIILPHFYGDRLIKVLRDEFPNYQDEIFLSEALGETLQVTEFGKAGYQKHLESVANRQPEVKEDITEQMSEPILATSLNGSYIRIFPDQKPIEINAGANVTATERAHSVFPVRFSDLIESIKKDPVLLETYSPDTLRRVERIAKKMEESHATTQIPHHHTLMEEDWFDRRGIIFIPHLKDPKKPKGGVEINGLRGGIYMNVSGSGIGEEMASVQAKELIRDGWTVLAPSSQNIEGAQPAGPDALYMERDGKKLIRGFVMRPGYGSIWHAIEAEIGIGYLPGSVYDSPEMRYNERALKNTRLGHVFAPREDMIDLMEESALEMWAYKRRMYSELNLPQGTSGIRVAAQNIIKSETGHL